MSNEIITMEAELVSDVIIEKVRNNWSSDYRTHIPLKVGNKVENITFTFSPDYRVDSTEKVIKCDLSPFKVLTETGIEINIDKAKDAYREAIKVCKHTQEEERIEEEKLEKIKRGEFYDNSWVHNFVAEVKGDKRNINKVVGIEIMDRNTYINGLGDIYVLVTYKGVVGKFYRERVGGRHNSELKYTVKDGYSEERLKLDNSWVHMEVTEYKERRAKIAKAVVHRWLSDIDAYFYIQESRKNRKIKEETERKELTQKLSDISGVPVESRSEYRRSHDSYSRRGSEGYYVWRNYIKVNDREFCIGLRSYTKDEKEVTKFSFNGIDNLTLKQFKSIIEVFK